MDVVEKYFPKTPPFNGKPRENQGEAIQEIYDAIHSGKKFIVLAAPTGAGKSAILYAISRAVNEMKGEGLYFDGDGSIFTTSQKLLQDQYEQDFSDMFVMKGRNNYHCYEPKGESGKCDSGICMYKQNRPGCYDTCPYRMAKLQAIESDKIVTNLAYFIGESNNVNAFGKRRLLVVDEAHTIESGLMSYVELAISNQILKFCQIDMTVPIHDSLAEYEDFLEVLNKIAIAKADEIDIRIKKNPDQVFESEVKRLDRLTNLVGKIAFLKFHKDTCKWIADPNEDKGRVVFKPINVSPFVKSMVFAFADIVILSSATISRSYVNNCLGIPNEDFLYIEVPSTFPVDNRPIYALNCGKMGYRFIQETLPKIVLKVDELLDEFPDRKGIIHATSYKIADYIKRQSRHKNRLINHNSVDRMERLKEHIESDEPTVLLSPSMTEGVDLKGDLSTFSIIVKIPYASLGDKQIKARMEEDKIWYANLAAVQMMQAYGRSIRSKTDVAMTFVLDSAFRYFVKSNNSLFCEWFKEAIR
jgi:Rad3-related DNA helicase